MRLKLWLPCLALSTAWVLVLPLSVSIHSLFRKGFERKLELEQEKSSKLDFLHCNLIVFVVSNRLKLCRTCVVIAVAGSHLHQRHSYYLMPFIMCP